MTVEWKDTTSYSRDEERIPRCWTAKFGDMAVTVLTGHIYHRGEWVMHFDPFYNAHPIGKVGEMFAPQAKETALRLARAKLAPVFKALDSAVNQI